MGNELWSAKKIKQEIYAEEVKTYLTVCFQPNQ